MHLHHGRIEVARKRGPRIIPAALQGDGGAESKRQDRLEPVKEDRLVNANSVHSYKRTMMAVATTAGRV